MLHYWLSWQPSNSPLYKVNFDDALFDLEQSAGLGVIIRNEARQVMVSLIKRALLSFTTIKVEAMAARRPLVLALEIGFDRVILEGDSLVLINVLQKQQVWMQTNKIKKEYKNKGRHSTKSKQRRNNSHSLSPFSHIVKDNSILPLVFQKYIISMYIDNVIL